MPPLPFPKSRSPVSFQKVRFVILQHQYTGCGRQSVPRPLPEKGNSRTFPKCTLPVNLCQRATKGSGCFFPGSHRHSVLQHLPRVAEMFPKHSHFIQGGSSQLGHNVLQGNTQPLSAAERIHLPSRCSGVLGWGPGHHFRESAKSLFPQKLSTVWLAVWTKVQNITISTSSPFLCQGQEHKHPPPEAARQTDAFRTAWSRRDWKLLGVGHAWHGPWCKSSVTVSPQV